MSTRNVPNPSLDNAVRILDSDFTIRENLWYDEFLDRILTTRDCKEPREWTAADDVWLQLYIQRMVGIERMGSEAARDAIKTFVQRYKRNCVRNYLDSIEWDKTDRIAHFFENIFGADRNEYTLAVSSNFFTAMVARIYKPGCQVDNMVVLEGGQGSFKSSVLRTLASDPWFTEMQESVQKPKDFAEIMQGKWMIEVAELAGFSKAETSTIKRTITARVDRYRDAYGRRAIDHPRRCVLVGTTNDDNYNRDPTGGRRWWPIRCHEFGKLDIVIENRDQYFAEAVHRYRAGNSWWLTPDEATRAEQAARYDDDPWSYDIAKYLSSRDQTRIETIAYDCIEVKKKEFNKSVQIRIASTLRHMGWTRKKKKIDGASVWAWFKPATKPDDGNESIEKIDPVNKIPF